MADKRGFDAYKKIISKEKPLPPEDSDWLMRVAADAANDEIVSHNNQVAHNKNNPAAAAAAAQALSAAKPKAPNQTPAAAFSPAKPVSPNKTNVPAAGGSFVKVPAPPPAKPASGASPPVREGTAAQESKYRRVAKFLILIGADEASVILANLDPEQVEEISREITTIRGITEEEAAGIFDEFRQLLTENYGLAGRSVGGVEEARRLLYAAFGPEKGEHYLKKAGLPQKETSFSFLEDLNGEQIALLLRDESPAACALILSRIAPKRAAAALAHGEAGWKLEVARRIGRLGQVSPEVLEKTAAALREKVRSIGSSSSGEAVDGLAALASILKQSDVSFGDKILTSLADDDPELGKELKERLYTLDDVIKADDKAIRIKLHEMNAKDIAVLIKGRDESFAEKILLNISTNRRAEVREEMDYLGPIPKKDSDAAIKSFMAWFREERESGNILLLGDDLIK